MWNLRHLNDGAAQVQRQVQRQVRRLAARVGSRTGGGQLQELPHGDHGAGRVLFLGRVEIIEDRQRAPGDIAMEAMGVGERKSAGRVRPRR